MEIGDKVFYREREYVLLSFSKDGTSCLIEGYDSGHSGNNLDYWFNKNGDHIPYIKGDRRRYVLLSELEGPESKWEIGQWYEFSASGGVQIGKLAKKGVNYVFSPWLCNKNYSYPEGHFNFENLVFLKQRKVEEEEIQKLLPSEHPDKLKYTIAEDLIGRYIKALVDYPDGGLVKQGEIGIIVQKSTVDFPSQKGYYLSIWEGKYELMPKNYSPLIDVPTQCEVEVEVEVQPTISVQEVSVELNEKFIDTSVKSIKSTGELLIKPTIYLF